MRHTPVRCLLAALIAGAGADGAGSRAHVGDGEAGVTMNSRARAALIVLAALALVARVTGAGTLDVHAASASPTQIRVDRTFYEDPLHPAGHLESIGYDVYRRSSAGCGDWLRVNPDVIPRVPGVTHLCSWLDTPPAAFTMHESAVYPADRARTRVGMGSPDCEPPCPPPAYAACPDLSAPLVQGFVTDLGRAVLLVPCGQGCWGSFYVSNPAANALRAYTGSSQVLRVYGMPNCGAVEGCGRTLDHFEPGDCGATPVRRGTWGRVKAAYR